MTDFVHSTFCQVQLGLMGNRHSWLSRWARWWSIRDQIQNSTQPNYQGDMGQPVFTHSRNLPHPFPEHSPLDGAGLAAHGGVREEDIDGVEGEPAPFLLPLRPAAHRTHHQRPLQPPSELRPRRRVRRQRQQRGVHRQRIQQPLRPHQELLQVRVFESNLVNSSTRLYECPILFSSVHPAQPRSFHYPLHR